jgi:hypothetical protein
VKRRHTPVDEAGGFLPNEVGKVRRRQSRGEGRDRDDEYR